MKKLKIKFYCPGPETQTIHYSRTSRALGTNVDNDKSFLSFIEESIAEEKEKEEINRRVKRNRLLLRSSSILPSWFTVPSEFGEIASVRKGAITYRSYRYGDVKFSWNDTEEAVEVKFLSPYFERVYNIFLDLYEPHIIDGTLRKLYVVRRQCRE